MAGRAGQQPVVHFGPRSRNLEVVGEAFAQQWDDKGSSINSPIEYTETSA